MTVKLLTEQHLEFLGLKGGCICQNVTLLEITCRGSNVDLRPIVIYDTQIYAYVSVRLE